MDKYDPETKIYKCNSSDKYYYLGEDDIRTEISDILDNNVLNSNINCNLVLFTCNNRLNEPFLEFLLFFDISNNHCNFDKFTTNNDEFNKIIEKITHNDNEFDSKQVFLDIIIKNICEKFKISKSEYLENFDYIGFIENELNSNNSELDLSLFICLNEDFYNNFEKKNKKGNENESNNGFFSFLNTSESEKENNDIDDLPSHLFAIIDEIVFLKHVNNIPIHSDIVNLFKDEKFMFLKTEKNEIVDLPIICYNANIILKDDEKVIEFIDNIKSEPQSFNTPFGKRFIFSKPDNLNDKMFSKYVLFLGNSTCIFNDKDVILNNTTLDFSNYKKEDTLIVTDLDNNTYYLANSIVHFLRK